MQTESKKSIEKHIEKQDNVPLIHNRLYKVQNRKWELLLSDVREYLQQEREIYKSAQKGRKN